MLRPSNGDSFENVESVRRSTDHGSGNLGVPMHFFDVFLSLVHEQELRWHLLSVVGFVGSGIHLVFVWLNS